MSPLKELPAGWAWATLRELADLKGGITKGQRRSSGAKIRSVPYLRVANVQRAFLDLSEVKNIDAEEGEIADLLLRPGDILFNEGGDRDKLGRGWIWRGELPECIHQNHVFRARLRSTDLQPKLISWYANFVGADYFSDEGKQTTNLASINLTKLGGFPVPVPPVEEQGRIVAEVEKHFTRLDASVEALKRVKAQLKRYRASVLKAACEGRLVPTEAELARREKRDYEPADKLLARILKERRARWEADQFAKMKAAGKLPKNDNWKARYVEPSMPPKEGLPILPEGWMWARLEQLTSVVTSGSRGWAEHYAEYGPLFIRAQDIKTDTLRLDSIARVSLPANAEGTRTRVNSGDLLVTITGANVTKSALVPNPISEGYVSQHVGLVRPIETEISAFLFIWVVSPAHGRRYLEKCAYGAGKPGLNLEQLREMLVVLPPLKEQQRIVAEVENRLSLADSGEMSVRANLNRAERLRQAVLRRAFEGGLVPQESKDEPASRLLDRISASVESRPFPKQGRAKQATSVPRIKVTR